MFSKQREVLNRLKSAARWIPSDLRRLVKVNTVDSYQGKENHIVVLSTVRRNVQQNAGFLRSPNRITWRCRVPWNSSWSSTLRPCGEARTREWSWS